MTAPASVRIKETVEHRAPLGIRCVDPLDGSTLTGLHATLQRTTGGSAPQLMASNPSGILIAHDLPGLARWEAADPQEARPALDFAVQIADPGGRFFPARFTLTLPAAGLGVPACLAPADALPLFALPARPVPQGCAAIRARLLRLPPPPLSEAALAAALPAAWALVELHQPRPAPAAPRLLASGLADARGEMLMVFAYPEPPAADGTPRSPFDHAWELSLSVRYAALDAASGMPSYCDLRGQPARQVATAITADPDPATTLNVATGAGLSLNLRYGRSLVATTPGRGALYVRPE